MPYNLVSFAILVATVRGFVLSFLLWKKSVNLI